MVSESCLLIWESLHLPTPQTHITFGECRGGSESHSVVFDSLRPHGLYIYSPWNSPGQNTGVGSCPLLQCIFPTWGSNPGLPHGRWILSHLSHQGSPRAMLAVPQRCCGSQASPAHPSDQVWLILSNSAQARLFREAQQVSFLIPESRYLVCSFLRQPLTVTLLSSRVCLLLQPVDSLETGTWVYPFLCSKPRVWPWKELRAHKWISDGRGVLMIPLWEENVIWLPWSWESHLSTCCFQREQTTVSWLRSGSRPAGSADSMSMDAVLTLRWPRHTSSYAETFLPFSPRQVNCWGILKNCLLSVLGRFKGLTFCQFFLSSHASFFSPPSMSFLPPCLLLP